MLDKLRTREELMGDYALAKPLVLQPINEIFIRVDFTDDEVGKITEYVTAGIEKVGTVVGTVGANYNGIKRTTSIEIQLDPNDKGVSLFKRLEIVVSNTERNAEYLKILEERRGVLDGLDFEDYLGGWKKGTLVFRGQVGRYLSQICEVVEDKWGIGREELFSKGARGYRSKVRWAAFYALMGKFPKVGDVDDNGYNSGLSTVAIGGIFGVDHSTVVTALKSVRGALPEPKEKNFDLVSGVLEEVVCALDGR